MALNVKAQVGSGNSDEMKAALSKVSAERDQLKELLKKTQAENEQLKQKASSVPDTSSI